MTKATRAKRLAITTALVALAAARAAAQAAPTAEDVIRRMDATGTFETVKATGSMISTDRFGDKRSDFISWSRGGSDFLIEFTNVEERGQKVLRVADELYLFYPDAEDIIPMRGAALKQSMFGDISYEDVTEGSDTLDKYSVRMTGEETVDGVACWVIEMTATSRDVPYPRQVIRVGKDDDVLRYGEYFALSGRLIKTVRTISIRTFPGGRAIITGMELEDKLRRDSKTVLRLDDVQVDLPLDDALFSLQSLY